MEFTPNFQAELVNFQGELVKIQAELVKVTFLITIWSKSHMDEFNTFVKNHNKYFNWAATNSQQGWIPITV